VGWPAYQESANGASIASFLSLLLFFLLRLRLRLRLHLSSPISHLHLLLIAVDDAKCHLLQSAAAINIYDLTDDRRWEVDCVENLVTSYQFSWIQLPSYRYLLCSALRECVCVCVYGLYLLHIACGVSSSMSISTSCGDTNNNERYQIAKPI